MTLAYPAVGLLHNPATPDVIDHAPDLVEYSRSCRTGYGLISDRKLPPVGAEFSPDPAIMMHAPTE
jgi:hypothetical protein